MCKFYITTSTFIVLIFKVSSLKTGHKCVATEETLECKGIRFPNDIPKVIPQSTTIVYLHGSEDATFLSAISDHAFQDPSWGKVSTLTLSDFQFIRKIGSYAFAGLNNLRNLSLIRLGKLREINSDAFNNTPLLEKLDLSFNPALSFFEVENAITNKIPKLEHLSLVGLNMQSTVPFIVGSNFTAALAGKELKYLDMSKANFASLNKDIIMNGFRNLRFLNLSFTIMAWMPRKLDDCMPNLETLDLSYCVSTPNQRDRNPPKVNTSKLGHNLQSLKQLYLNGLNLLGNIKRHGSITIDPGWLNSSLELFELRESDIRWLNVTLLGHLDKFKKLDMSNGQLEFISPKFLSYFAPMKTLMLGGNRLGKMEHMEEFYELLSNLRQLEWLYLNNNGLTTVPKQFVSNSREIKFLDLHANHFNEIKLDIRHLVNLKYLDLSKNKLRKLPMEIVEALDGVVDKQQTIYLAETNKPTHTETNRVENSHSDNGRIDSMKNIPHTLIVDITENPLECSCDSLYFVDWISNTRVNLINRSELTCRFQDAELKLNKEGVSHLHFQCAKLTIIIVSGISVSVAMVIGVVIFCFLRRHCYRNKSRGPMLAKDSHATYDDNIKYVRCDSKRAMM